MWGERVPILMISGFGTVDTAVRALHLGADDFLAKPVEPDLLSARVADLLARRPLLEAAAPNPAGMVGRSPKMREALAAIARVAVGDTTVLVDRRDRHRERARCTRGTRSFAGASAHPSSP